MQNLICLIVHIQEQILEKRDFVGLISGGDAMRAVGSGQVDIMSAWTIKYTLRVFVENILPTKYLYGCNQCQVQFMSLFLHFN